MIQTTKQLSVGIILAGVILFLALTPLTLQAAGPPNFVAMWGFGVDTGASAFEVCTPASLPCQGGILGSGNGQFSFPAGIAVDSLGNVYVSDSGNHRIQKFTGSGTFINDWGSSGDGADQFSGPVGIAIDSANNVYVADSLNHRIQKFSSDGTFLRMWGFGVDTGSAAFEVCTSASLPCQAGSSGGDAGQFNSPVGVAVDGSNNVYVVDSLNHRIQKFSSDGTFLTEWGASGSGNGQFNQPAGIGVDSAGDVYVADTLNFRVQKFNGDGTFVKDWGSLGFGDGQFSMVAGVTVDQSDNIYVSDRSNSRIQKFSSDGAFLTKWGTPGSGAGQFNAPADVAVDNAENVYVVEESNHRVQKFGQTLLTLDKTVDNPNPDPGQRVTYSIIVVNNSPTPTTNAVISDTLPDGLTVAGPVTLEGTTTGSTGPPPTLASGLTISGDTRITVTLPVTVNAGQDHFTVINNVAAITSSEVVTPVADSEAIILFDITKPVFITDNLNTGSPLITPTLDILLDHARPVFDWYAATDNGQVLTYTLTLTGPTTTLQFQIVSDITPITHISFTATIDLSNGVYTWTIQVEDGAGNVGDLAIPTQSFSVQAEGSNTIFLPTILKRN